MTRQPSARLSAGFLRDGEYEVTVASDAQGRRVDRGRDQSSSTGLLTLAAVSLVGSLARVAAAGASGYHLIKTVPVPGEDGWDYLAVDSDARRVYVSHGTHVVVMNADTYAIEGDIPDTPGVHGIAIASDLGRGFISSGRANTATIFDLKTFKTIGTVKTDGNPDAIAYDAVTKRVFTFNGRGKKRPPSTGPMAPSPARSLSAASRNSPSRTAKAVSTSTTKTPPNSSRSTPKKSPKLTAGPGPL